MATDRLIRARASAPAGEVIVATLQLEHPLFAAPYFLTTASEPFTATVDGQPVTFVPYPFQVVLPSVDGAGQQDMQITLSNAAFDVGDAVRLAHTDTKHRIQATYREFLGPEPDAPQSAPIRLELNDVQVTDEAVAGVAGRSDVLNRRFPGIHYDVQHFVGLDR